MIQKPPRSAIFLLRLSLMARSQLLGARFHCLPLQGQERCFGQRQLSRPQADRAAIKILERIVDGLIRQVVSFDDSRFGFVPGRGTTDAIFVVQSLQEKYLAVNKRESI